MFFPDSPVSFLLILHQFVTIDIAEQRAETHIVLTEGIVPYLTKILIQCENKPEITDGTNRIPVTVCCQILFQFSSIPLFFDMDATRFLCQSQCKVCIHYDFRPICVMALSMMPLFLMRLAVGTLQPNTRAIPSMP